MDPVDIFFLLLRDLEEELPSDILERDRLEGDSWFPLTAGDSGLDLDLAFFFLLGQEKVERGGVQPLLDLSELWLDPACRRGASSCWASRNSERSSSSSISGGD